MSRVRRRGLIGVAMAAAGLLVLAPPAGATKKPRKPGPVIAVSATAAATGDGALAQAHAVCPPKTRAVGGGFSETPPFDILGGGFVGVVFDFEKLGQKAWRAKAQNLDPGPPNTVVLTVYVYCRRHAAKTGTASVSNGTAVPNILPPPGVATCVNGKAGAGGYTTAPPVTDTGLLQNQVIGSFPNGAKAWQTTTATGNDAVATTSFGGFAYCARFPKRTAPRPTAIAGPAVSSPDSTSSVIASCRGTRTPVAGGFTQGATPSSYFIPYESQRLDKGWRVSGIHFGAAPASLTAVALCG